MYAYGWFRVVLTNTSQQHGKAGQCSGARTLGSWWPKINYMQVETKNVTRNCETVAIATMNGMYPGPTLDINEGDTMVIKVTSNVDNDVTLHWWDLIPLSN